MKITITINTGNDAFYEDPEAEIGRILTKLIDTIPGRLEPDNSWPLIDYNGGTVGKVTVSDS